MLFRVGTLHELVVVLRETLGHLLVELLSPPEVEVRLVLPGPLDSVQHVGPKPLLRDSCASPLKEAGAVLVGFACRRLIVPQGAVVRVWVGEPIGGRGAHCSGLCGGLRGSLPPA